MKALMIVFWIAVGGVGISFIGTIATYFKQRPAPTQVIAIPTPAELPAR